MKIVVNVIKADIGSIGGHIKPSQKHKEAVSNNFNRGAFYDHFIEHSNSADLPYSGGNSVQDACDVGDLTEGTSTKENKR
jgi:hypothetical protein